MNKLSTILTTLTCASIIGCASQVSTEPASAFQASSVNTTYGQKTKNALIIADTSSSMKDQYSPDDQTLPNSSKFSAEKELIHRFVSTASGVDANVGLRSFGFGSCSSWGFTELHQEFTPLANASSTAGTISCAGGGSPMGKAIHAAHKDLEPAQGPSALVVFSDGKEPGFSPLNEVKSLKEQYNDLCIYTVWIGNAEDVAGKTRLAGLSNASGCGFSTNASNISTPDQMARFVERVFYNSPQGVAYNDNFADSDGDGVIDELDQCPNTPRGAPVNFAGCWEISGVYFDFNKSEIKPGFYPILNQHIEILKQNPNLKYEVQGHTDSLGPEQYNLKLSDQRARSIEHYFSSHGIPSESLTSQGYGESRPIDSNETKEGRQHNRRVEIQVVK